MLEFKLTHVSKIDPCNLRYSQIKTNHKEWSHEWVYVYHYLLFDFDSALAQGSDFESFEPGKSGAPNPQQTECHSQTDWAIEDQAKAWTRQPVPMLREHSAHLTSLPDYFHPWLLRYKYLLLDFDNALAQGSDY